MDAQYPQTSERKVNAKMMLPVYSPIFFLICGDTGFSLNSRSLSLFSMCKGFNVKIKGFQGSPGNTEILAAAGGQTGGHCDISQSS